MDNPELEKKLQELRLRKKEVVKDLTRKSIDAINLSEQCTSKTQLLLLENQPVTNSPPKEEVPISKSKKDQDAA